MHPFPWFGMAPVAPPVMVAMTRHNVPLGDAGYERVSVCGGSTDHRHRIVPGSTFVIAEADVPSFDGGWPSYCGLCHIGRGYSKELLKRLQTAGAVERV